MISNESIQKLYSTISRDLSIDKFIGESQASFHKRITYSAIGKWILQLCLDKDFEDDTNKEISKSHVTISAMNLLSAYKKVDSSLVDYFTDDKKLINEIENIYSILGYVESRRYSFCEPSCVLPFMIGDKMLDINASSKYNLMYGLDIWSINQTVKTQLSDFALAKLDAIQSFESLV